MTTNQQNSPFNISQSGNQNTPGTFGGATPTTGNMTTHQNTSQTTAPKSSTYTPLDQLSSDEKAAFQAPKFVLGKIPTRPPPRELV